LMELFADLLIFDSTCWVNIMGKTWKKWSGWSSFSLFTRGILIHHWGWESSGNSWDFWRLN
jgi:hypothetical protein